MDAEKKSKLESRTIASANDSESGFEPYGLNTGTASARLVKSRKFFFCV